MKNLLLISILNLFGAMSIGNGIWMLVSASTWYDHIPAGIHDTGPLNSHFVHDIGWVYFIMGLALLWCARKLNSCLAIYLVVLLFNIGHALIHVVEISLGLLPPSHWYIDFPLIFLPTLILVFITPSIVKLNQKENL